VEDPVGVEGHLPVVGDQNQGVPLPVDLLEERHDLHPGAGVQVARGLVGQQDGRPVDQGPGDGHPLALAA